MRQLSTWPLSCIHARIAEEVEEDGLGEGIELGEGGAALGPQGFSPIKDVGNPPLLREWWQRELGLVEPAKVNTCLRGLVSRSCELSLKVALLSDVQEEFFAEHAVPRTQRCNPALKDSRTPIRYH